MPGMDGLLEEVKSDQAKSNYTVLARRYRSTEFDEVVGQEPIAQTLKNAIARNRIAHAYLFCGTRGVGKTSMARIFAKQLNATDDLSEKDAIAAAILRGEDIDVIEIDAASNTGVDNVRDLIANACLTPARCPYKVYIIDEVHMLSRNAFNALLKIMEEPPSHVKFILCTTEPEKVPATIQSRCQRFDFRNIPASKIAAHLQEVLEGEGVKGEEAAVREVARLANGSMRDGLSLLDRLIAAGDGTLTIDTVRDTLGTPDQTIIAEVVSAIADSDAGRALEKAGELLNHGVSAERAFEILAEHFRNVMVLASCGEDSDLCELFGDARDLARDHAKQFDAPALVHLIALLEAAAARAKGSSISRAIFDAVIVRLALAEHVASIPMLLSGKVPALPDAPAPGPGHAPRASAEKKNSEMMNAPAPSSRTESPPSPVEMKPPGEGHEEVRRHPAVKQALEMFDGKVVGVRDLKEES